MSPAAPYVYSDAAEFNRDGAAKLWDAIALGLVAVGGARPELALGFFDRFDIP